VEYKGRMASEEQGPETVVARLRPHARVLFWPSVFLIAIAGGTAYLSSAVREPWQQTAVLAAGAALAVLLWLLPLLSWLAHRTTITTRRLVIRSGLLVRRRQEILHSRSFDLVVRQNAVQSLFRSGDVHINTGLERPVVLHDVPGVDLVQAALTDLMEQNSLPPSRRQQQSRFGDGTPSRDDR
jgi:membrane protein YdbS with pleckstrin-like domain